MRQFGHKAAIRGLRDGMDLVPKRFDTPKGQRGGVLGRSTIRATPGLAPKTNGFDGGLPHTHQGKACTETMLNKHADVNPGDSVRSLRAAVGYKFQASSFRAHIA